MYEHYITSFQNGVIDIQVEIDEDEFWDVDEGSTEDDEITFNEAATKVSVEFAVTTDSTAWITIDGNGFVHPAFGGTGVNQRELDRYAEQAVSIWRSISGDKSTTCRYKIPDGDDHNQDDPEHVINA